MTLHAPRPLGASDASQAEWVARVRAGDEAAFGAMFAAYYQPLCRFALNVVGTADAAEDMVQNVFVAIWERRSELEIRQTLRVYLYTAVRNRAVMEVRKSRTRERLRRLHFFGGFFGESGSVSPAEAPLAQAELADAIEAAIAALPPRGQQAYRLHRDHGLTYDEVAQVMGISAKTVSVHIGRALLTLRKSLGQYLAPVIGLIVLR